MDVKKFLEMQQKEIDRYKSIESEKAGKDLGYEAVVDWIMNYAHRFSDNFFNSIQKKQT
jgi:hypothetical protein